MPSLSGLRDSKFMFRGIGDSESGLVTPASGGGFDPLPDPVVVANAVPSMRIAMHSEEDVANDYEFGSLWDVTSGGTFTDPDSGSMGYMRTSAAAGGSTVAGRETNLADWPADHSPIFNSFVYPEQLTDIRYFVGFTTNSLATQLAGRLPAGSFFGLVFDSAVDSTWVCVTSNGVGPPDTYVTSVAPSTTVRQIIRGDLNFGVDARFYIDGIAVGVMTANLPGTGTMMRQANGFMNLSAIQAGYCGFLFEQAGSLKGGL